MNQIKAEDKLTEILEEYDIPNKDVLYRRISVLMAQYADSVYSETKNKCFDEGYDLGVRALNK